MKVQWYPGHMTKAFRQMRDDIKMIDLVIELLDARVPMSSRNPDIDSLSKGKSRLVLLNKADLADESQTDKWINYFDSQGIVALKINSKDRHTLKQFDDAVAMVCKDKIESNKNKGINRPIRAMVVGIPNVGKSTFINTYVKKAATKTGNKPGVTKGKQWIRLNDRIELLDTPGILWPRFEDEKIGINLAFIGSINDQILSIEDLTFELIKFLNEHYPNVVKDRYGIEGDEDIVQVMYQIAEARGCRLKGNRLDLEKASHIIIDEFRAGKLGRVTLDRA